MDAERRAVVSQKIIEILTEFETLPAFFVADKIINQVLNKELDRVRDEYVRLLYTNTDVKN